MTLTQHLRWLKDGSLTDIIITDILTQQLAVFHYSQFSHRNHVVFSQKFLSNNEKNLNSDAVYVHNVVSEKDWCVWGRSSPLESLMQL